MISHVERPFVESRGKRNKRSRPPGASKWRLGGQRRRGGGAGRWTSWREKGEGLEKGTNNPRATQDFVYSYLPCTLDASAENSSVTENRSEILVAFVCRY